MTTADNRADAVSPVLTRMPSSREAVPLPDYSPSYLRASLVTPRAGTTRVYVRQTEQGQASPGGRLRRRVVGVERTAAPTAQRP